VAPGTLTSPECLTKAIKLVEDEEGEMGMESVMLAVDLFQCDCKAPIAYLAFSKMEMRRAWLHCQLAQTTQNTAILDNYSMFPSVDTL